MEEPEGIENVSEEEELMAPGTDEGAEKDEEDEESSE